MAYVDAAPGELEAESLPSLEYKLGSLYLADDLNRLSNTLPELGKRLETSPDDKALKDEIERVRTEFLRKKEVKSRLIEELKGARSELDHLTNRLAESPNDQGLQNEMERLKAEFHRKIQHYNEVMIPRCKRIMEGDMQPEDMPWDRAHGGKVSATFRHRGKEMPVSDEEAEALRVFLDDHVSEWLRGNQYATEGLLNQIIIVGSVTIRKENGYSRTYVIVHGEGLRWNDCYLPLCRVYADPLFDEICSRYINNVSKLPIDPEARKLLERSPHK